ncbi:NAD-dependent epimerase/dehydratase family protein [Burkholderia sp. 22PA0106]|uniref:NAD-dependent epimerase/dehydratase family protein n=1 Tax=Burkholderia sp. 22PA0106 TaxID=3237371 RepID=UPI0039C43F45
MNGKAGTKHPVVALTGATGFIGAALLPKLASSGYRVRALCRPRPGRILQSTSNLEWVPGDLDDHAALEALVDGADSVIHCAGAVRGARRADFDRVNESGVINLVQAAENAPGCRRFLLLSSLAAREPQLSDYSASKRRGERALAANAHRLDWTVLRPPAVYGPGDREMVALFRGMARGWAPVPGAARGRFSLIYVTDLARALVAWLAADVGHGQTYELDDGHAGGYGWHAVLDIAARTLRGGTPIHRVPVPIVFFRLVGWGNLAAARFFGYAPMLTPGKVREVTHANWVCDGSAFAQATGWRPAYGFERGLACTLGKPDTVLERGS